MVAGQDRFTDSYFLMSIGGGGEQTRASVTGDRGVNRAKQHFEGVWKTLDVAGWVINERSHFRPEAGRAAKGHFVGAIPVAQRQLLRVLRAPPGRFLRTINFNSDAVLAASGNLRHRQIAASPVTEFQQDTGKIFGLYAILGIPRLGVGFRERFDFADRPFARLVPGRQIREHRRIRAPRMKLTVSIQ